jgi:hypothetical protein
VDEQQRNHGRGKVGGTRQVLFVELCNKKDVVTQGTGTATTVRVGPAFRDLGPYLQDIVVHGKGYNDTNGLFYTVKAEYSYDGEDWEPFAAVLMAVTSPNVSKTRVSAAYTSRADFGRQIRFLVELDDSNAGVATGQLSLSVAFHFLS